MIIECNRAWVFGDDIDTDVLAPSAYMKKSVEEVAKHCLEAIDPGFAAAVRPGDAFVAGANLGVGSSREQAPQALKYLGVAAVLAESFAGLFYRNAINLGLPVLVCAQARRIPPLARLEVDAEKGRARDATSGETYDCEPIPPHLMQIIRDGGLLTHLERRLAGEAKQTRELR